MKCFILEERQIRRSAAGLFRIRFGLVFAVLFFLSTIHAGLADQVEVMSSSGQVQVLLNGTEEYTVVQEGMLLQAGDAIKTGSGATAELSFNDENTNVVRLSENTAINVTFSGEEKLELSEGEAFASIGKLESGSSFEIRTPTVVSGARGTDWVTKVTSEGTDVEAINDEPYVRHFDRKGNVSERLTTIKPGQMTTVKKFQRPREMRPINAERREQWQKVKQSVKQNSEVALIRRGQRPRFDRKEFMRQRQKPAAMPTAERFEGKNVLESRPRKEAVGGNPQDKPGFKPLKERSGERDDFKPLASRENGREGPKHDAAQQESKGFKPLGSDAHRKSPEHGELKSFEDRKAIKEAQKKAGRIEGLPEEAEGTKQKRAGKESPADKGVEPGVRKQDAGAGKQDRMPKKDLPAFRPQAAPVRR